MRFHVVGMGAIGCLVSFHLRRALDLAHSVTVIHKLPRQVEEAKRAGNSVKLEHSGVVLPANGFRNQCYNNSATEPTTPRSASSPGPARRSRTVLGPRISQRRMPEASKSAPEVFFDGLKQSVKDLFSPRAAKLLRTGRFWSDRGPRQVETSRPARRRSRLPTSSTTLEPIDTLFVCVKAQATLETIRGLLPWLTPKSTIVLLQNGMGVYDELVDNLFPNPLQRPHIITGIITHGAWIKSYLHIVHAGIGKIDVGIMPDGNNRDFEASYNNPNNVDLFRTPRLSLSDIVQKGDSEDRYRTLREALEVLLSMKELQISWLPIYDVLMAQRRKLVVNAVINPITAILDCKNGQVLKHPEGRRLCRSICKEAEAVFRAQWDAEHREAGVMDMQIFPPELTASSLEETCVSVAETTAQNVSSMLADVRMGRPTEIKYMTGYVLGLGKKYGVPTLTNRTLYNLIRLRTKLNVSSDSISASTAAT